MKLFISYARVDKPLCKQIVANLDDIYEVWYDQRLFAGQDWWVEIQERLQWCEGFIYLLSPEAVKSEYCQKEYEIAEGLAKHILPVLIQAETEIPASLRRIHYVDLSKSAENLTELLKAITHAERNGPRPLVVKPLPASARLETENPVVKSTSPIGDAAEAMEAKDFDKAVFILKQAQEQIPTGRNARIIANMLQEAENELEQQAYLREAEREYAPIAELVKRERTRKIGCEEFADFHREFPEYDPQNLDKLCNDVPDFDSMTAEEVKAWMENLAKQQAKPRRRRISTTSSPFSSLHPLPPDISKILPSPFEWCEIPPGTAIIAYGGHLGDVKFEVERFWIAKYPITNVQFQVFVDDQDGYGDLRWWDYGREGLDWLRTNHRTIETGFEGTDLPRTNVSWYEAVGFCKWLSWKTKLIGFYPETNQELHLNTLSLRLPREQEWQRAAQGDDRRMFPWGGKFYKDRVNAYPSGISMPTEVTRYPGGASPYGVLGMSGNIWEMTISEWDGERIVVRGGSFGNTAEEVSTIYRAPQLKDERNNASGFRIMMHAQGEL